MQQARLARTSKLRRDKEMTMTVKSLGDPFDGDVDLVHGAACSCSACASGHAVHAAPKPDALPLSNEAMLERAVESAVA